MSAWLFVEKVTARAPAFCFSAPNVLERLSIMQNAVQFISDMRTKKKVKKKKKKKKKRNQIEINTV